MYVSDKCRRMILNLELDLYSTFQQILNNPFSFVMSGIHFNGITVSTLDIFDILKLFETGKCNSSYTLSAEISQKKPMQ